MGIVAQKIKAMSQENILAFESAGEVTFADYCLKLTDIKVCLLPVERVIQFALGCLILVPR